MTSTGDLRLSGPSVDPSGPRKYYRARYYDPKVGRFISEDPIGFLGEDMNLYGYVWNNPVNWLDPSGLKGRRPTPRNVAIKTLRDLMKDPDTQRNEQCFSVCEKAGQDPFSTSPKYGTSEDCPITFCPTGSTLRYFCHVHPCVGGYPGHSPREAGGQDFYWPDKLGVPSMVGQGGNIWEYDPNTRKETQICCKKMSDLMRAYRALRHVGVSAIAMLTLVPMAFADADHPCSMIPTGAQSALERSVNSLRREHSATLTDWQGQPVQLRGALACVSAVLADFDGTGSKDVVGLYRVGDATDHMVILSAFQSNGQWRGNVVEIVPAAETISLLSAGEYARVSALTRELRPGERAVVTSTRPGVALILPSASCLAFFLGEHRWVFTETGCK